MNRRAHRITHHFALLSCLAVGCADSTSRSPTGGDQQPESAGGIQSLLVESYAVDAGEAARALGIDYYVVQSFADHRLQILLSQSDVGDAGSIALVAEGSVMRVTVALADDGDDVELVITEGEVQFMIGGAVRAVYRLTDAGLARIAGGDFSDLESHLAVMTAVAGDGVLRRETSGSATCGGDTRRCATSGGSSAPPDLADWCGCCANGGVGCCVVCQAWEILTAIWDLYW